MNLFMFNPLLFYYIIIKWKINKMTSSKPREMPDNFEKMIAAAPSDPGVYEMFDSAGLPLYVGKAKNLARRLRQYVDPERLEYHKIIMRRQVARVEWRTTASESEALILEQRLIKTEKPKYNIILKDDKTYPYLALSGDKFPRLYRFRDKMLRESRSGKPRESVFGPFPFISDLDETIRLVQRVCRIRTCADSVFGRRSRPCLLYQVGRCSAPCVAARDDDYGDRVRIAKNILRGRVRSVVSDLARKMKSAAAARDYENAARIKGQIDSLQSTVKTAMIPKEGKKK
jgi:excinuclease ABC subunit C